MTDDAKKRLFCSVPFERLEMHAGGECFVCCPGWLPRALGKLTPDTSFAELWNGDIARDIRAGILDGSFRHCDENRCPHLASATGHVTDREVARQDPRLRAIIDEGRTVLDDGPLTVNASYDASCNLSCPSCRSSTIVASGDSLRSILALQAQFAEQVLPSAKRLWITGSGDPFAATSFRELLRQMDPARYPNLELVWLHTNALLWTPENWARMKRIHHLIQAAEISIDAATPETYAENRRGGDFATLLQNLEFISGLGIQVTVSFVVQANNFREMPAFVELGRKRFDFAVYFSKLFNWGTYSDAEYRSRAVFDPDHPEHAAFLDVLADPILETPRVRIGNLTSLKPAGGPRRLPVVSTAGN